MVTLVTQTNTQSVNNIERYYFPFRRRHSYSIFIPPWLFVKGFFTFPFLTVNRSIGKCGSVRYLVEYSIYFVHTQLLVNSPYLSFIVFDIWCAFIKWHIASRDYFTSVWCGLRIALLFYFFFFGFYSLFFFQTKLKENFFTTFASLHFSVYFLAVAGLYSDTYPLYDIKMTLWCGVCNS